MPHTAGVQMYEGSARCRVKSAPTALRPQARFAQLLERHARDVEIDRLAQHVLAELGDPARAPPQHRVGLGRAVSAHDPDQLDAAAALERSEEHTSELQSHLNLVC